MGVVDFVGLDWMGVRPWYDEVAKLHGTLLNGHCGGRFGNGIMETGVCWNWTRGTPACLKTEVGACRRLLGGEPIGAERLGRANSNDTLAVRRVG